MAEGPGSQRASFSGGPIYNTGEGQHASSSGQLLVDKKEAWCSEPDGITSTLQG